MVNSQAVGKVFNFAKGLNSDSNATVIDENETTVCQDIELSNPNQFSKRKGLADVKAYVWSPTGNTAQGLFRYRLTDGTEYAVTNRSDGKFYKMDSLDGTWDDRTPTGVTYSTTATARWEYAVLNDLLVGVEGTNQIQWDGSTETNETATLSGASGSPPAGAIDVEEWLDKLWMITNANTFIYWSKAKNPLLWETVNDNTPIGYADGSLPKCVKKSGNYLYVWSYPTGLYRVIPAQDDSIVARVVRISETGAPCPKAVTHTPYGFVWYSGESVWLWDENGAAQDIGEPIRDELNSITAGKKDEVVVTYNPQKNQVWVAVPYGSGTTANNRVFVATLKGGVRWAKYTISANDFAFFETSGVDEMYCMESGLDGQFQEVLTGDNDGLVAGIKQSIDGQLMSKWFSPADWGLGSRSAYLDGIQIIVTADGDWNVNIGFERDFGGGAAQYTINQNSGGFIIGTNVIGDAIGGGTDITHEQRFKGKSFGYIRFFVENKIADQTFTIKSIRVAVAPRWV